jgi:hypothetical protein
MEDKAAELTMIILSKMAHHDCWYGPNVKGKWWELQIRPMCYTAQPS